MKQNLIQKDLLSHKRTADDRFVQKRDIKLDNRYVVPYNRKLLVMFQAHLNFQWCNKEKKIKYLFTYMNKGPYRATMIIEENISTNEATRQEEVKNIDEIEKYQECRYLSVCEASSKLFEFDIHHRSIIVLMLTFHLPNQ